MRTLKFKTNIKCSGCIAKVIPHLDEAQGIDKWEVDIYNPAKPLTVETGTLSEEEVKAIIEKAGFNAEPIQ